MPATKVKQIKKTIGNANKESVNNVSNLFDRIFNADPLLDPNIIHPRCTTIKTIMTRYSNILGIFYKYEMINDICKEEDLLTGDYEKIGTYINDMNSYISSEIEFRLSLDDMVKKNITMDEAMSNDSYFDETISRELTDHYNSVKKGDYVNSMIELLKNMMPYKTELSEDNFRWIESVPGCSLNLFPFSDLNFKFIYNFEFDDKDYTNHKNKFIHGILQKLYKCCAEMHGVITEAGFDISAFVDLIIDNLGTFRKDVPRCDEAFDVITEALGRMKSNFGKYYKDYEITNDPSMILEAFLKDLYDDNKNNPKIIAQLKKIISHYSNKITNNSNVSPKVSNLVSKLNSFAAREDTKEMSAKDLFETIQELHP